MSRECPKSPTGKHQYTYRDECIWCGAKRGSITYRGKEVEVSGPILREKFDTIKFEKFLRDAIADEAKATLEYDSWADKLQALIDVKGYDPNVIKMMSYLRGIAFVEGAHRTGLQEMLGGISFVTKLAEK